LRQPLIKILLFGEELDRLDNLKLFERESVMKGVSIPLPDFLDQQIAEIEVKINGKKRHYNFRVESFRWKTDGEEWNIERKIKKLREGIKNSNKSRELIQIFRPKENSKFVQALFRQVGNI